MRSLSIRSKPGPNPGAINEFVVAPPRKPAFDGEAWVEPMKRHLSEAFPDLTINVTHYSEVRAFDQFLVLPVVGCVGDDGDGGWSNPVTEETNALMARIAAVAESFDPDAPGPRLH